MTTTTAVKPHSSRSFINRLTTGTGAFNIMGKRRYYYIVSGVLVVLFVVVMFVRQFNFGIEFAGGTKVQLPQTAQTTTQEVARLIEASTGVADATVQTVGSGASATVQVRTSTLSATQVSDAKKALSTAFGIPENQISDSAVSETWGSSISRQAAIALAVFLVLVSIFLWLRYERRVAVGALVAVFHDLIITAGIYSLVGFEVTPATVIGLLAILGFSLYDTVVVYDKVQENTKGLTSLLRRNYEEAANLAINQTLMRSLNTSLIALLPVAGLLVAGVAILGSGTLKDLALVQLVGMIVSSYSSVFLAVPVAVDLRLRDPLIRAHTARVAARRKAEGLIVDADGDPVGRVGGTAPAKPHGPVIPVELADAAARVVGSAPKPGAKPVPKNQRSVSGPKAPRPAGKTGRPTGKRAR